MITFTEAEIIEKFPVALGLRMDYNKAFQAYDSIEGSRCITTPQPMSQMDAALEAVRMIGLNQKEEIRREWFSDPAQWKMFQKRIICLQMLPGLLSVPVLLSLLSLYSENRKAASICCDPTKWRRFCYFSS